MIFGADGVLTRDTTGRIYRRLKRTLLQLKRAVSPLIDVTNRLMRLDEARARAHASLLPR